MPKHTNRHITAEETPDEKKQLIDEVNSLRSELAYKNRELEIETSLEKVRSVAMAMREAEEMLNICTVISKQLELLGVQEIRNVQTAIFNETKGTYFNYEYYAKHDKTVFTETNYQNNELHNAFAEEMLKGAGKVFIRTIPKHELKSWIAYQKTTNVFIDPFLETAPSLTYHWYSLGAVALGISTYEPLTDEALNLFKRFKNVFELAYTRHHDIKKAEAQAYEARIEASLERVRAQAMSMIKSDELLKVCESVFTELRSLGFTETDLRNTQIVINNDVKGMYYGYQFSDYTGGEIAEVPYNLHPIIKLLNDKLRQSKDAFADIEISGDALKDWKKFVNSFPQKHDDKLNAATELHYYFYSVGIGALGISSFKPLQDEKLKILQRLRNVFNLSYQRYSDITLAEAQAREAELERKRSEDLLLNILPLEIANELKQFGKSYARKHEQVTILFSDIKDFSIISETLSPEELVNQLDECFRAFDHIVMKHGLEKIKTIGDAYVCACGLPNPDPDNAVKTVRASMDMLAFTKGFGMTKKIQDLPVFDFRFGIHTGPVITGVVGLKKFTYDIWGDAVNMAARMEQHGEAGKINISGATYQLVKEKFTCTYRGKIEAKNKGIVDMYFVE